MTVITINRLIGVVVRKIAPSPVRSLTPLAICTGTSGLHSQSATQLPSVAFTSLSRWFVRIAPRSDCHQSLLISSVITVNIVCSYMVGVLFSIDNGRVKQWIGIAIAR